MKTSIKFQWVVLITFFAATTLSAQEWTKEQLEVWKGIEEGWKIVTSFDVESMNAAYHEQFQGWGNDTYLPISKEMALENARVYTAMGVKINFFRINPARIVVTDNAAVVDYYFAYNVTEPNGNGETENLTVSGKRVMFLVKEGGNWLLLGDMHISKPEE